MVRMKQARLSARLEDYVEVIFHISEEKQAARSKDIAEQLNVTCSSVTGALQSLSEKGIVNYAPYDFVTLTSSGRALAKNIVRRHRALKDFFVNILGVDEGEAEASACKMEHALSEPILARLTAYLEELAHGN